MGNIFFCELSFTGVVHSLQGIQGWTWSCPQYPLPGWIIGSLLAAVSGFQHVCRDEYLLEYFECLEMVYSGRPWWWSNDEET